MQLVFGVCSGTAPGGRDKDLCPRAPGPCQDQSGPGRNSGGERDGGDGVSGVGGGEVCPHTGGEGRQAHLKPTRPQRTLATSAV